MKADQSNHWLQTEPGVSAQGFLLLQGVTLDGSGCAAMCLGFQLELLKKKKKNSSGEANFFVFLAPLTSEMGLRSTRTALTAAPASTH